MIWHEQSAQKILSLTEHLIVAWLYYYCKLLRRIVTILTNSVCGTNMFPNDTYWTNIFHFFFVEMYRKCFVVEVVHAKLSNCQRYTFKCSCTTFNQLSWLQPISYFFRYSIIDISTITDYNTKTHTTGVLVDVVFTIVFIISICTIMILISA